MTPDDDTPRALHQARADARQWRDLAHALQARLDAATTAALDRDAHDQRCTCTTGGQHRDGTIHALLVGYKPGATYTPAERGNGQEVIQ